MDNRQGFLTSLFAHVLLLTLFASAPESKDASEEAPEPQKTSRVFLPPPEVLRQLAPRPAVPPPLPSPTPPPSQGKDRISIGAPSQLRQKGPLVLRRDDDLTKAAKGTPEGAPTPLGTPTPAPQVARQAPPAGADEQAGRTGLRLPPLRGPSPPGADGSRASPGEQERSIASSLRDFERQLDARKGPLGALTGTGRDMGPLFFDPQGADFTLWIQRFKQEVYRNWMIPQSVVMGLGGEVQFRFTVQRDGRMSDLTMLKSSGAPALDQAARGALKGSLLLALPADYAPSEVTMTVTFYYGAPPRRGG